jgi:hypothetical protein
VATGGQPAVSTYLCARAQAAAARGCHSTCASPVTWGASQWYRRCVTSRSALAASSCAARKPSAGRAWLAVLTVHAPPLPLSFPPHPILYASCLEERSVDHLRAQFGSSAAPAPRATADSQLLVAALVTPWSRRLPTTPETAQPGRSRGRCAAGCGVSGGIHLTARCVRRAAAAGRLAQRRLSRLPSEQPAARPTRAAARAGPRERRRVLRPHASKYRATFSAPPYPHYVYLQPNDKKRAVPTPCGSCAAPPALCGTLVAEISRARTDRQ